MADYIATIGLETHVQLKTASKVWCACPNLSDAPPNTLVCPVCMGYPGALPVLNIKAVELMVKTGLMLGCEINRYSKHDRKSYFYPDMPKNYQITQFDEPLCLGGGLDIVPEKGAPGHVRLNRIHLEEDVGKSTHFPSTSGVDYNRAGTPLMEIVTEPDIHTADEAVAYLTGLKEILIYGNISDCNMEEGHLRCDINISVAPKGSATLGTKTELKNMNSFRNIHKATSYEIKRQIKVLEEGGSIVQETRRWDDEAGVTSSMRSKEEAHDYRYFPDPDLLPIVLSEDQINKWKESLPELPKAKRTRFSDEYGLPEYDASVLVGDAAVADFFEAVVKAGGSPKMASNWIMTEVLRVLSETGKSLSALPLTPNALGTLLKLVDKKTINQTTAKELFAELVEHGGDPESLVQERGLAQVSDASSIDAFVQQAIEENPGPVSDYKGGKGAALQFLVGQVMRFSRGKANPQLAAEALKRALDTA